MNRVAVLGAGLVGRLIARDLASCPTLRVVSWDRSDEALALLQGVERLDARRADLSRPE